VITVLPSYTPQVTPVEPTVATDDVLLLHVPPDVASERLIQDPIHTAVPPLMAAGLANTVTVLTARQALPVLMRYVILVVPAVKPYTMPVVDPTVATVVAELLHVPPAVPSLKVMVEPAHIEEAPLMAVGDGITVSVAVV
jgi:hypothetical protein